MEEIRSLQVLSLLHFAHSDCSVTAAVFNNITDSLAKPSTLCLVSTLPSCLQYGPAQPQVIENSCLNNLGLSQGTSFLLSSSQGCDRQVHSLLPNKTAEAIQMGTYSHWQIDLIASLPPSVGASTYVLTIIDIYTRLLLVNPA